MIFAFLSPTCCMIMSQVAHRNHCWCRCEPHARRAVKGQRFGFLSSLNWFIRGRGWLASGEENPLRLGLRSNVSVNIHFEIAVSFKYCSVFLIGFETWRSSYSVCVCVCEKETGWVLLARVYFRSYSTLLSWCQPCVFTQRWLCISVFFYSNVFNMRMDRFCISAWEVIKVMSKKFSI